MSTDAEPVGPAPGQGAYDPASPGLPSFSACSGAFADGTDNPRAFLERCLERVEAAEPSVQAFTFLDIAGARTAADAAWARWRSGAPKSSIDGMPYAVKDCFDVRDMPTECGSPYWAGHVADTDAAHVWAMRRGGAIALGKTVTTEFTMARSGPTRNPWDLARTPAGSSSGSAAAVAARMVPFATGSQVRGSNLRPASVCGVIGMKPTLGSLNRHGGIDPVPSLNHLGLLAGSLKHLCAVAAHLAATVGGDPGHSALNLGPAVPQGRKPIRLLRVDTAGWDLTGEQTRASFEGLLRHLHRQGVEIVAPDADPGLQAYEQAVGDVLGFFYDLLFWEARWPLLDWFARRPEAFSPALALYLGRAETLTPSDYERALSARDELRRKHRKLAATFDGCITLAHPGAGRIGLQEPGTPHFCDAFSIIGAPALSLPLLVDEGCPLGVQLVGHISADADLVAMGRWLLEGPFAPA